MNNFPSYNISMTETHHIHKLDAPSGTAITLAEGIIENVDRKDRWTLETAEQPTDLPIHAIREGEVPGIHEVTWSRMSTISVSSMMPRAAQVSHSALSLPLNLPGRKAFWVWTICLNFNSTLVSK